MNGFLKWFFAFISEMLGGFALIFKGLWHGIKQIFNVKEYVNIFKSYSTEFGALSWVLAVIAIIIVAAIFALLIFMIVLAVRKYLRFRHSIVSNEDLIEEIADLQRKVVKMAKEKDDIMAMKVAQMGLPNKAGQALSLGEDGITAADERTELPLNAEAVTSDGVIQTTASRSLWRQTPFTPTTPRPLTTTRSPSAAFAKLTATSPARVCTFITTSRRYAFSSRAWFPQSL